MTNADEHDQATGKAFDLDYEHESALRENERRENARLADEENGATT